MIKSEIIHLLKYALSRVEGVVQNGQVISVVTKTQVTNVITFENAGTTIYNLDQTNFDNTDDIIFVAKSGVVGTGGLTVQLYDVDNAVEITSLAFVNAEDNTVKFDSIKAYLESVGGGRITLEVNIRRTGGGTVGAIACATIEVFGV